VCFDGDSEASLCCISRDRLKNLINVSVSQNNSKNTGLRAGMCTSSFDRKCKFVLVVGGARDPLWRGARLEEIDQTGLKPALCSTAIGVANFF